MANERVGKWTPVDGAVNILVDGEWDPSISLEARVEALETL